MMLTSLEITYLWFCWRNFDDFERFWDWV